MKKITERISKNSELKLFAKMVVCQKLLQRLQYLLVILLRLSLIVTFAHTTATKVGIRCIEKEREALLKFKDELIDDYGKLSTWGSEEDKKDCCGWDHVHCDNLTNHIVELDLYQAQLRGNISISLLDLQHLEYLDLSVNAFYGIRIPQFIGSLSKLQRLNLVQSGLSGEIPHHLGNLSKLEYLGLGRYNTFSNRNLTITNVDWLSRLHSLRSLNLRYVNLSTATNWLQTLNKLIRLQELTLSNCDVPMVLSPSRSLFNSSTTLHVLDLSGNELTSSWIFPLLFNSNLSYLSDLTLSRNNLQGPVPDALGNLSRLESLDLSYNHLTGVVSHLTLSSSLKSIQLDGNMFNGTISQMLKSLSKLEVLQLGSNYFQDIITESHFFNLSQLFSLGFSDNPGILFNFSLGWKPPFQLANLNLAGCKVGPLFPAWLRTQKELSTLFISNAEISGTFPDWFLEQSPKVTYLIASNNNFHGALPNSFSKLSYFLAIDLSDNHFNGSVPIMPSDGTALLLSNNNFSGSITKLCNGTYISWIYLDLSNNLLSGQLPDCLANATSLESLNLAHNNFSGEIPSLNSVGLFSLHLQNNHFTGEIPTSLRNCTSLAFIDLSHNRLIGKIPTWIGDTSNNLVFLILKSNKFFGSLPSNLCRLARLQVLDLSLNKISGRIPRCLNSFTAMSRVDNYFDDFFWILDSIGMPGLASLTWKGIEHEYKTMDLQLMKLIDLSSNNLVGDVPVEITNLVTLVGLNLSRNNLSRTIPSKIGQLRSLDSLDLSRNHFTGDIPTGISHMDQLGVLDLSYNNLSGKIPQSNHMQTFSNSSFEGNNGLCGLPVTKTCPEAEIDHDPNIGDNVDKKKSQEDDEKFVDHGLYISIVLGFIVGFWGVCGTLVLNNSRRIAFFQLSDKVIDWCYVRIAISKNRLRKAFQKFVTF